jgi:hypothetical protein
MSLTTIILCAVVEVAEAEIVLEAEIAVIFVNVSDAHILILWGCGFPILLIEAYWKISTMGKN